MAGVLWVLAPLVLAVGVALMVVGSRLSGLQTVGAAATALGLIAGVASVLYDSLYWFSPVWKHLVRWDAAGLFAIGMVLLAVGAIKDKD